MPREQKWQPHPSFTLQRIRLSTWAYRMMRDLFVVENKPFESLARDEYLNTYDECLEAVKGFRKRKVGTAD